MRQGQSWSESKSRRKRTHRIKGFGEKAGGASTCTWVPMAPRMALLAAHEGSSLPPEPDSQSRGGEAEVVRGREFCLVMGQKEAAPKPL